MTSIPQSQATPTGEFMGHPKGLFVLFFAELWERFNFYGMRALLIFYMAKTFLFDDEFGPLSYGAYNGLVYATPLIGGMIADRILGYRRAIIFGGILMALGEFGLCLSGFGIIPQGLIPFYLSLGLIIAGNGFFKPNISTMVGTLYKQGDPRRDGAFTIFYMGINIGAALAPILCGIAADRYGFHYGFGLAGIGMVLGLCSFIFFTKHLGQHGTPPQSPDGSGPGLKNMMVAIGTVAAIPVAAYLVSKPHFVEAYAARIVGAVFLAYVLWEAARATKAERQGIFVILILSGFSIMFWAFFEQAGSSMNVFTERHVNRVVLGWEIPAPAFQAVNAIFIVLLAPIFSALWLGLGRKGKNPSSALKFSLGLMQLGLGFVALVIAGRQVDSGAKASLIFLVLAYFFHTTGELCVSPVGLSMVTKMAPVKLAGMLMGMWFLCTAFAHIVGGKLASFSADWGFTKLYTVIFFSAVGSGVLLLLLYPLIKKWELARLASHHEN
jgi:POT family proton-dependent oligopeptide transporter